nr:FtsW/RodA/SpoVE family cell cycle protein [uncultured Cetobacterium sp.]
MKVENIEKYHKENLLKIEERLKKREKKLRQRRISILLIILILLMISGINMVSAAFYMKPGYIWKHYFYIGVFLLTYIFVGNLGKIKKINFNYRKLSGRKINVIILVGSVIVLLGMFIGGKLGLPFIPKINGAYGWINLGPISIQPAEILKCAFIINLANCLAKCEDRDANQWEIILCSMIYLIIYSVLILLQKDLGTTIHYMGIFLFMIFMSKIDMKIILKTTFLVLASSISLLMYWYKFIPVENAGYKIMRVKSYIDGLFLGNYSDDFGYQVKQSVYAFGSGGFSGKGYFNGVQKYSYLPEIHTDFIMATFGEEFGILGMFIVMGLFFALFYFIISSGRECKNYFGKYLAIGIGGQLITQVIINIFVAVGLLPVFGLPMPLFSYGGSAMLTMGITLGLIHNLNSD